MMGFLDVRIRKEDYDKMAAKTMAACRYDIRMARIALNHIIYDLLRQKGFEFDANGEPREPYDHRGASEGNDYHHVFTQGHPEKLQELGL